LEFKRPVSDSDPNDPRNMTDRLSNRKAACIIGLDLLHRMMREGQEDGDDRWKNCLPQIERLKTDLFQTLLAIRAARNLPPLEDLNETEAQRVITDMENELNQETNTRRAEEIQYSLGQVKGRMVVLIEERQAKDGKVKPPPTRIQLDTLSMRASLGPMGK